MGQVHIFLDISFHMITVKFPSATRCSPKKPPVEKPALSNIDSIGKAKTFTHGIELPASG